jgi:hypothetical protein
VIEKKMKSGSGGSTLYSRAFEHEDVGEAGNLDVGSLVGVEEEIGRAFEVEDVGGDVGEAEDLDVGSFHEGLEKENAWLEELNGDEVGDSGVRGLNAESFPHLQARAVAAASHWEGPSPVRIKSCSTSFTRSITMDASGELDGDEVGSGGVGGLDAESFSYLQACAVIAASRWEGLSPAHFESCSASFTRSITMDASDENVIGGGATVVLCRMDIQFDEAQQR